MQRAELRVTGIVQGVGFRPFCARTAEALGLCGTVRNTSGGVEILLEGKKSLIDAFILAMREDHPSAAVISGVDVRRVSLSDLTSPLFSDFSVIESRRSNSEKSEGLIPPDLAVCEDCLAEMRDPPNRRYRYPFINCTNCGPRYTIIRELPYDRPMTTMKNFAMCHECELEYKNALDRRYHAQPNACPKCGPRVRLTDSAGHAICEGEAAIARLTAEISAGKLAAIKGIGGFHIACLPEDNPVRELRLRKHRPDKPFALMAKDMDAARRLTLISLEAERLMTGTQRPIVLCRLKDGAPVSHLAAPGQKRLGLMLPYAPLHHLIMENFDALVMTSANISDAPIVSSEAEAFSSLGGIVDFCLCHDREIHAPIDDSVLLPVDNTNNAIPPVFLRRARGYAPNPMPLAAAYAKTPYTPNILAAGAQMKSTYTLTRGNVLFPGQYLGDLGQLGTAAYYKNSLARFIRLYEIAPKIFAFDKHPGYTATELAKEFVSPDSHICPVQHHHAHLASVLFDNGYSEPAIGVIFDGTGYGDDGTIWGGEFLVGDANHVERMASLLPFKLPGGEKAIHEPWRCGLALIAEIGETETAKKIWPELMHMIEPVTAALKFAPVTTSCGRLFDGISAILDLCKTASYDGQAAVALENAATDSIKSAAREHEDKNFSFEITTGKDGFVILDWRNAVRSLLRRKVRPEDAALIFHQILAIAVTDTCVLLREKTGINHAALSGGVWQNALLLELTYKTLSERGFTVLTHCSISPNDEGVSVGQAIVAAHQFHRGTQTSGAGLV